MSGRAGRTTIVYFVSQVLNSVAGFLATWVIANQLGGEILGEYSAVVSLLFWLNVPSSAIGYSMNKRISEEGERSAYLAAGNLLVGAIVFVLAVGILVGGGVVNTIVDHQIAPLLVVLVAGNAAFDVALGSLRGDKQVGKSGFIKTFEQVFRTGFQVVVVVASAGFAYLVVGHAAALFLSAAIGFVWLRSLPTLPGRRHFSRLLEFARYSWLGTLKLRAFGWMDVTVMSVFAGYAALGFAGVTHEQIGIYNAAWAMASVLALMSVSIKQTLFPELSDMSADGDLDRVRHFVNEGLSFTGLFLIPGLLGAILLGDDLLAIYRQSFRVGHWILVMLIGSRLLASFGSQLLGAINAVDRPDIAFRINLAFLVVNLVGNVALVATYGWYGAAFATVLSGAVSFAASLAGVEYVVGDIDIPYREVGYQVAAGLVMFGALAAIGTQIPSGRVIAVLLVGLGAGIYGVVLLALSRRLRRKVDAFVPIGTLA